MSKKSIIVSIAVGVFFWIITAKLWVEFMGAAFLVALFISSDFNTNKTGQKDNNALAVKYHPDRVARLGDEAIRQATESMKEINYAWDFVKEARGIK